MKRILFVDDESRVLDGIRRMLYTQRDRWEMQFALGGEAALQACEAGSFDVVISDMRMPVMDGATLLGHIRDRYPNTARIILSGHSEIAMATRAVPVAHRFLAKPCSASELLSTIERVCMLQDLLCAPGIRTIVGKVGELPSLSITYMSLTRAVSDPDAPVERVAHIIEQDVAMSAKVLQLVNSAFFGLAQKINTLQSAVGYLGMETIKNLALASEAFRAFVPDARIPQSICESMQNHANSAAAIAGALPVDQKIREVVVVSALLHDIGSLILASVMPVEFCFARSSAVEKGCAVFLAEEELLGTSHAEIGAYLLGLWGLPHLAVEAIANHHHPARVPHSGLDCTVAVYLADLLAHELQAHPQGSVGLPIKERDRANLETLGFLSSFNDFRELALESRN
ncbi:MAG: HDOD domain-containing protein [Terracidiphilus sp.]|jgi:HD-like signal output (HDOD) protein